jgi:hypothetical protein
MWCPEGRRVRCQGHYGWGRTAEHSERDGSSCDKESLLASRRSAEIQGGGKTRTSALGGLHCFPNTREEAKCRLDVWRRSRW